jgi:class 3 adenylate cyclase
VVISAPLPANEPERLAALLELGILDTAPDERFERITRLARHLFGVPMVAVSFVDANRQWFKACFGLPPELPRDSAFCAHAILRSNTLVIPDALQDPRFADNPLVLGEPFIRFYAGHPLHSPSGHPVGTLCIIDREPRELTADQIGLLRDLATMVEHELNLEHRVRRQVEFLERVNRLRYHLPPQVVDRIVNEGDQRFLAAHRSDVTVVFCDLRGFTAFSEGAEPEEVMEVLGQYHATLGPVISAFEGTLEHFAGDGLMVLFNDPLPCEDHVLRAVRMAVGMREGMRELHAHWNTHGYTLDFGVGIARGFVTLGEIGFRGRMHYGAIGSVANLASRLCDEAKGDQILIAPRAFREVKDLVEAEPLGTFTLKGFARSIEVHNVIRLKEPAPPE